MKREDLDLWLERTLLGLALIILGFGPIGLGAVRTQEFLVLQGLTGLAGCVWLVRMWCNSSHRLMFPPLVWGVLAFVGYAVYAYYRAPLEYVAREELIRVVVYAVFLLVVLNNLQRQESVTWVVFGMLFVGTVISTYAVYQFVTQSNLVLGFVRPEQYAKRGSGTYICPNHLAGFLELVLPVGLSYLLTGRLSHLTRVFVGYAVLMILGGFLSTISRGGYMAAGIAVFVMLLHLSARVDTRWIARTFLGLLLVGTALFFSRAEISRNRLFEIFDGGTIENIRFRLWQPAIRIWQDHAWTGAGPGHFDFLFKGYRPEKVQIHPYRVHNDYLNTLADWGVIGFGLIVLCLVALVYGLFRTWKFSQRGGDLGSRTSNRAAFLLGSAVALLAILIHSLVDFNLHIPANALLAVAWAGLMTNHWRHATDRFWWRPRWFGRIVVTGVIGAAVVFLVDRGLLRWREHVPLNRAAELDLEIQSLGVELERSRAGTNDTTRVAARIEAAQAALAHALKEAWAVDPRNFETAYRIGEGYRVQSWRGGASYRAEAEEAMRWFDTAMRMNPFDPLPRLRMGMCLDYLGRVGEAGPHFEKAAALDPNGYYTVAHLGWHALHQGDLRKAHELFGRSLRLKPHEKPEDNPMAARYHAIVEIRMQEAARSAAP